MKQEKKMSQQFLYNILILRSFLLLQQPIWTLYYIVENKSSKKMKLWVLRYDIRILYVRVLVCCEQAPKTDAPWGIISVKGQLCDYELPMQPITMMRNALGKEYGGSGVPLDFAKYQQSVAFWTKNVALK